jgi:hypothetical protein
MTPLPAAGIFSKIEKSAVYYLQFDLVFQPGDQ